MKLKNTLVRLLMLSLSIFLGCGDDDDNTAQFGLWLASEVEFSECTNTSLNGSGNCGNDVGSGHTYSCVRLNLTQDSYTLSVNFNSNQTNEVGTWESSQGNIRLCPNVGTCYDVSISTSDFNNMTFNLPRNGGCIAIAQMVKV